MDIDLSVAEPKQHELKILFDPKSQSVGISFDKDEFKTWDFILGVIEMGKRAAEFSKQQAMMMQAMQQQAAAQQMQKQIHRGGLR